MLRISRLLSYAAVAVALWLGALQLDLSRNIRISVLAVSECSSVDIQTEKLFFIGLKSIVNIIDVTCSLWRGFRTVMHRAYVRAQGMASHLMQSSLRSIFLQIRDDVNSFWSHVYCAPFAGSFSRTGPLWSVFAGPLGTWSLNLQGLP